MVGDASYYNFKDADGKEYKDIAWYVPPPLLGRIEMELMYQVLPNPNERRRESRWTSRFQR
jgi:uncharacterized protein (DUF427 family)